MGGGKLELDTKAGKIGDGAEVARFTAVNGAKVRVTPVARFSPPGATPVGVITAGGETREIAKLADSSPDLPDAHQSLMPPFEDGRDVVEFDAPDEPFAFFMRGHKYLSATDPALAESVEGLDLAEICITSDISVSLKLAPAGAFTMDEVRGVAVVFACAKGAKCARSWRYTDDVGSDPDFPDVSARDAAALHELRALGRL